MIVTRSHADKLEQLGRVLGDAKDILAISAELRHLFDLEDFVAELADNPEDCDCGGECQFCIAVSRTRARKAAEVEEVPHAV